MRFLLGVVFGGLNGLALSSCFEVALHSLTVLVTPHLSTTTGSLPLIRDFDHC